MEESEGLAAVEIRHLSHAEAREMAKLLSAFLERGETVRADERTNSILIHARTERVRAIADLAADLDKAPTAPIAEPPSSAKAAAARTDDLFAPAQSDLVIEMGEDGAAPSLWRLAQQYARITGQHMVASEETRVLLESSPVPLSASVNVPAPGAQVFFESIMVSSHVVLCPLPNTEPQLVNLISLRTQERSNALGYAVRLDFEEAAVAARQHPAVIFQTTISMQVDVRQLSNAMRTMMPDINTTQLLPAGNTNVLILRGLGIGLAPLIETLRAIDAAPAQLPREQPAQGDGAQSGQGL
jgi:type II secretory pathway component GspD/PulD (secretin)